MKEKATLLAAAIVVGGVMTVLGQGQGQPQDAERTPGVQAGNDPKAAAWVMANCKTPPEAPAARGGGPGGPGGAGRAGGGAPPAPPTASEDYMVTAIPGVIAANQRWKLVWEDKGNHADGLARAERQEHHRAHRQGREGLGHLHRYLHRRIDRREPARADLRR